MTMNISFHGADHDVTGSCHLIECHGKTLLIDCGLYQGERELAEENSEPFGFEPADIDYLLLTHAHLDHCGRIPLLVQRGFQGEIITTAASRELARLVMLDAGHLQEGEAEYQARKAARSSHHRHRHPVKPLYSVLDALNSTEIFERHLECYDAETKKLLRHPLKHNLWRPESSVIFVGYAARGTLARKIVDGAATVHIYHEEIPAHAKIFTIGGFSAHADQTELLTWRRHTGNPKRTFLVHGDKEVMEHFTTKLSGTKVAMPTLHRNLPCKGNDSGLCSSFPTFLMGIY